VDKRNTPSKRGIRPRATQERSMVPSNAQFQLRGGVIESGFFSGPHLSSFSLWPNPPAPDPGFAPFYQRALSGDLRALVDFYRVRGSNPGAAFYTCIGYLAACGSSDEAKTVEKIISINLRGGPQRSGPAKKESVREWGKRLLPPAKSAAEWIAQQRRRDQAENHHPLTREQLSQKCVDQNLNPISLRRRSPTRPKTGILTGWSAAASPLAPKTSPFSGKRSSPFPVLPRAGGFRLSNSLPLLGTK
jgi:hypothetical protein